MARVELRAFGSLMNIFSARGWTFPAEVEIFPGETPGTLMERLGIPPEEVEAVFVNGRVERKDCPLQDGDRVAFVPAGIPSVHRVMLGFYGKR
ncbi:MoaD/ThiS family protein [Desulfovirgula thermocuniculi]|uniref:MoaD/ThiS family protein n=1 Tax=Desulfovirgula thermocuniculi TaxID=348842 RepID=UPI00054EEB03|nr:MoaD/ThiS family protein [Desulfovirgula thermocuniculi]